MYSTSNALIATIVAATLSRCAGDSR